MSFDSRHVTGSPVLSYKDLHKIIIKFFSFCSFTTSLINLTKMDLRGFHFRPINSSNKRKRRAEAKHARGPLLARKSKAPAKRSQHANATHRNIVGRNILPAFGQRIAVLRHVGCCCCF